MVRLFIALDIEPAAVESLRPAVDFLSRYRSILKTVEPENFHITLKFLGECGAGLADDVERGFAALGPPRSAVPYELKGLGSFPGMDRASVLWCGVRADETMVRDIFGAIERFTTALGFAPEKRGFTPHVTLARVRKGMKVTAPIAEFVKKNADTGYGTSEFCSITLYSSRLTPQGPLYTALKKIILP
ncbi:MAG: RNA 2',3'-cyclic phosphodiesterase [Spirochaetes bacterium]|nr:RNA 2',3'-cyclic phosphodiesterase [Spirochaetota bacterium]